MNVADSFGGGGIGVFDDPDNPGAVSRPRFTPHTPAGSNFNAGAARDTRYAFAVLANGPLRSMVRVRTMNWDSGKGRYEVEQVYTAYAGQDYTTATVHFGRFDPAAPGAAYAVGIRQRPGETGFVQDGGTVITTAPEVIRNPDDLEAVQPDMAVDFAGTALVVRAEYAPAYVFSPARGGNHLLRVEPTADNRFEYLLAAGWSEGAGPSTAGEFQSWVGKVAREYSAPIRFVSAAQESKGAASSP
jgi:chitodextrinase